jgi:hypothetical protein
MHKTGIIVLMIATTLVVSATADYRVGVEFTHKWDEMDQDEQYDTCVAQCSAAVNYRMTALRYALLKQKCRTLCQTSPSVSTAEALRFGSRRLRSSRGGRRLISHPWLTTLATARLNSGPTGSCVATTLGNMDRLNIPSFSGGTTADPNNSRGAMVQMIGAGKWKSLNLPGSKWTTIRSAYGTVNAYVINADSYERMAFRGEIPSGAIIFQTRWGWTVSSSASGNDMGIVRNGGRNTFNYQLMNPIIYSNAKEVVILIPGSSSSGGGGGSSSGGSSSECKICVKNGGGGGCVSRCSGAGYSCTNCLKNGGGKGCLNRCSGASFDVYEGDAEMFFGRRLKTKKLKILRNSLGQKVLRKSAFSYKYIEATGKYKVRCPVYRIKCKSGYHKTLGSFEELKVENAGFARCRSLPLCTPVELRTDVIWPDRPSYIF